MAEYPKSEVARGFGNTSCNLPQTQITFSYIEVKDRLKLSYKVVYLVENNPTI